MTQTRKAARRELADLLRTALVGEGLPAYAVYPYQVGDFGGAFPVVTVSSAGSGRTQKAVRYQAQQFRLFIHIFVAYSATDDSGAVVWTEEQAEDALDEIEEIIAGVIAANQTGTAWKSIAYDGVSETDAVIIGGGEYRRESIPLLVA